MNRPIISLTQIIFVLALCFTTAAYTQEKEDQRIINKIPTKVPLKIEIINGGMNSALGDLEIRITNKSKLPIYYFSLSLGSEEEFAPRERVGLTALKFGNFRLSDFSQSFDSLEAERAATAPLNPGETFSFGIDKKMVEPFWNLMEERGLSRKSRITLEFSHLRFGDGTGYTSMSAVDMADPKL